MRYQVKYSILIILWFYLPMSLFAQQPDTITFSGVVINNGGTLPSNIVKLNPYNESSPKFETTLKSDNSFQFKVPLKDISFYEVVYAKYSKSILFSKTEFNPGFKIITGSGKPMEMYITNSYENVAHEILRSLLVTFRDTLKGFRESCVVNKNNCIKYWGDLITDYNMHVQQIINDYPQTFTGQVLAPFFLTPSISNAQSPIEQMEKHYFDGLNFTDLRIYLTSDIATKFVTYLNNIADTSSLGRYTFINDIFMKTMGNVEANKKLALALYNLFSQTNRDNYLVTMSEWLDTRPWAEEQLSVILARLKLYTKVMPGTAAPEIIATDVNGDKKKLSDVVKSSKVTMALFWESDCPHCLEAMPVFKKIFEKYHPKGFNIYAASLDVISDQWKKYLKDNNLPWINVNIETTNPALENYYIRATPSIALIDNKGLIIQRFMDVKDLEGDIEKLFK